MNHRARRLVLSSNKWRRLNTQPTVCGEHRSGAAPLYLKLWKVSSEEDKDPPDMDIDRGQRLPISVLPITPRLLHPPPPPEEAPTRNNVDQATAATVLQA